MGIKNGKHANGARIGTQDWEIRQGSKKEDERKSDKGKREKGIDKSEARKGK